MDLPRKPAREGLKARPLCPLGGGSRPAKQLLGRRGGRCRSAFGCPILIQGAHTTSKTAISYGNDRLSYEKNKRPSFLSPIESAMLPMALAPRADLRATRVPGSRHRARGRLLGLRSLNIALNGANSHGLLGCASQRRAAGQCARRFSAARTAAALARRVCQRHGHGVHDACSRLQ